MSRWGSDIFRKPDSRCHIRARTSRPQFHMFWNVFWSLEYAKVYYMGGRRAERPGGCPDRARRERKRGRRTRRPERRVRGERRAPRKRNPETIYVKARLLRFALPESIAKCRRHGIRDPVHARVAECEGGWNREKSRVKRRDWSDSVMVG